MDSRELWRTLSVVGEYVGLSFACPGKDLSEALTCGEYLSATREIREVLSLDADDQGLSFIASLVGKGEKRALADVRVEYTRLFVGAPKPIVRPYEGSFRLAGEGRDDIVLMVNPYAQQVASFYDECGIAVLSSEPGDHVSLELQALSYLAGVEAGLLSPAAPLDAGALFARFLEDHLEAWACDFAEKVIDADRTGFYRSAAEVLQSYTAFARRALLAC